MSKSSLQDMVATAAAKLNAFLIANETEKPSQLNPKSNKSSPAGMVSDFSEKSSSVNKSSNSLKDVDKKHFVNRNKNSKIEKVKNPDIDRKPPPNIKNLQNPRNPPSKKSKHPRYPPEYPFSRSLIDDRFEDYRYPPRPRVTHHIVYRHYDGFRAPYFAARPPYLYNTPYSMNNDYYNWPPNYRGYQYDQYSRDPYYAPYYDAHSNYNYVVPSHYLEPDVDSNLSEISAYNIPQDYSYDDIPNDMSLSAEVAAKINAISITNRKLKSPSQLNPKNSYTLVYEIKANGDSITAEVDINDAPTKAKYLLTARSQMQDKIGKLSGVSISIKGRYMTPEECQCIATAECRPLYLKLEGSSLDAIKVAIHQIQEIIDAHTLPVQSHFVEDKVFLGLKQLPPDYPVREKILGPGGSFLHHIRIETGATIALKGKGSGFIEPTLGRESFEPLYIHITHTKPERLQAAKALAVNLIDSVHIDFAQWQLAQQTIPLTSVALPQATPVACQNQGIPSPTINTHPVANTTPVSAKPANAVLAKPAVPEVSIIDMVPPMPAAATYTATQPHAPFPNQKKLPYTQPVGYISAPAPETNVSPTFMVMTASDTANYPVEIPVPVPEVKQEVDVAKHRFYTEMESPEAHADKEPSPCLQESNVNHPTEHLARRGEMEHPAEDRDLMSPPQTIVPTPLTPVNNEEEEHLARREEMEPPAEDRDLMSPPPTIVQAPLTPVNNEEEGILGTYLEEEGILDSYLEEEATPVEQILHDKFSEMSKQKFERRLALLKAYNIYKAEFSSSDEDDESVWEKIVGTVRISCSYNCWTIDDCRLQLSQMKEKYEKKDRDWYLVSRSEADDLFEEEKQAFGYRGRKKRKNKPDENPEPERKKLMRGIGGLASYVWIR